MPTRMVSLFQTTPWKAESHESIDPTLESESCRLTFRVSKHLHPAAAGAYSDSEEQQASCCMGDFTSHAYAESFQGDVWPQLFSWLLHHLDEIPESLGFKGSCMACIESQKFHADAQHENQASFHASRKISSSTEAGCLRVKALHSRNQYTLFHRFQHFMFAGFFCVLI